MQSFITKVNSLILGIQINVRLGGNELDDGIGLISIFAIRSTLTPDNNIKTVDAGNVQLGGATQHIQVVVKRFPRGKGCDKRVILALF